jgi:hypothetical protein
MITKLRKLKKHTRIALDRLGALAARLEAMAGRKWRPLADTTNGLFALKAQNKIAQGNALGFTSHRDVKP